MDLALVARLLVAHERELREVRQCLDIDVLLAEPHAKAAVQQAVAAAPEGPGIRVAAFKAVVDAEIAKETDQYPETQYDPAVVDAARAVFEARMDAIAAATTHEDVDALTE